MVTSDRSNKRTSESWLARLFSRFRSDGKRSKAVQSGDRFGKVAEVFDGTQTTWQVWQIVNFVDMLHAKLIQEQPPHRIVTVSVSTLLDRRFYRRLAAAADVRSPEPPALSEAAPEPDEPRQGASLPVLPEPLLEVDRTRDTTSSDDIIRFLEPEKTAVVATTNPFSKARIGKRRAEKAASRITH